MSKKFEPLLLTNVTTVNALGRGTAAVYDALIQGRTGLAPCDFPGCDIDTFVGKAEGLDDVSITGELSDFDCRNNRLAQAALQTDGFEAAVASAVSRFGSDRIAVIIGSSTSGLQEGELAYDRREDFGGDLPKSFCFSQTHDFFSVSDFVRRYLGLTGLVATVTTACSSSAKTFVDAIHLIESGLCDAAVVGGVDSLTLLCLYGFNSLELLSREMCKPSDVSRSGMSIGEAAGFALLERSTHYEAQANSQKLVAVIGYGESTDAYHMSSPHPEGRGAVTAMRAAISGAGLTPEDIQYVNLHGTGTFANDKIEALAVHTVFGSETLCSSTKGWTGHTLGSSGITEGIISALCIQNGFVPQNLNMSVVDPEFDCHIVEEAQNRPVHHVLSNSFGFGGNNCSLVFGAVS